MVSSGSLLYCVLVTPPLDHIPIHFNLIHEILPYFLNIIFNVISSYIYKV
jgi:hypothetical protein